jgi:fatty acid desaturase
LYADSKSQVFEPGETALPVVVQMVLVVVLVVVVVVAGVMGVVVVAVVVIVLVVVTFIVVVSVVDWLQAGRQRGWSSSPGRVKNFLHVV